MQRCASAHHESAWVVGEVGGSSTSPELTTKGGGGSYGRTTMTTKRRRPGKRCSERMQRTTGRTFWPQRFVGEGVERRQWRTAARPRVSASPGSRGAEGERVRGEMRGGGRGARGGPPYPFGDAAEGEHVERPRRNSRSVGGTGEGDDRVGFAPSPLETSLEIAGRSFFLFFLFSFYFFSVFDLIEQPNELQKE